MCKIFILIESKCFPACRKPFWLLFQSGCKKWPLNLLLLRMFNYNVVTAKGCFFMKLNIQHFTEICENILILIRIGENYRNFTRAGQFSDVISLPFLLQFIHFCVCGFWMRQRDSWWSKHTNWDKVFLTLRNEDKNSCQSKYISRSQWTPKPLLRSWRIKMTVCSVKYQLTQLLPYSNC